MKRAVLNYWVDMITGVAFLFCAVTGIVRLFPEATTLSAAGTPAILGVSTALWATIHDWSGVVMAAGVGVHTVLHLRWLTHMTRKMAGGSRKKRVDPPHPAAARVATTAASASPNPSASTPQVAAAGSLGHLEQMGKTRRTDQPSRMNRKAFLAGSALVGGVALLGGLAIAGRKAESSTAGETHVSKPQGGDESGQLGNGWGQGSQDGSSGSASESSNGSSSPSDGTADAGTPSGTTAQPARVVVDSGRCTGCGDCLQVCPHGVFSFDGSKAVAQNPDACTLCGRCLQVCQTSAITLNG